ncbi:hypothetical protein PGT21_024376 [Puccinia graminis f. sp. tritici]|uniref:Uncharacterized protein n=1 Tax=Puccinia graminis f. sp. tritici TaxID=56615 RepID=A0A5B0RCP6_PUCGR|nr:hypothetical protein PGT21_024376 [Puccinia graminis f. sp. tritici]KAA1123477.1 hypothetical protein PGTUg99_018490 [Puccinia graminis f. sp. tritici]
MQTDATELWCIASHRFADAILIHCIEESDAGPRITLAMRCDKGPIRCDTYACIASQCETPTQAIHPTQPKWKSLSAPSNPLTLPLLSHHWELRTLSAYLEVTGSPSSKIQTKITHLKNLDNRLYLSGYTVNSIRL